MKGALGITCGLMMGSTFLALFGIVGHFDSEYSYCDRTTTPCTQVVAPVWYGTSPQNSQFIAGAGLTRTITSVLGACLSGLGVLVSAQGLNAKQLDEREAREAKILEATKCSLLNQEELEKVAIASEMRVKDFQRELTDGYAYLHLEKNPHLVEELTKPTIPQSLPEVASDFEQSSQPPIPESLPIPAEPEQPKIPEGIQVMLDSDLKQIIDAGIISLVGSQGSGKTSTSCMFLRYRVWRNHKLVVINPHKRKSMYRGLEAHLEPGTTFYGVGIGDEGRARSLLDGLEKVLSIIGNRYDEYQHKDETEYNHYPITILLEECAEYDGLLSCFNCPPNKATGDEGFSARKYLTQFWKKLFVSSRKGNCFVIRTIQSDTNTTNGTEGLSELIKSSGACTLTQFSVPDGDCIGGWRSTGEGEMKIPNQKYTDPNGNTVDAKPVIVPTYWDYSKILKDVTDFSDLVPPGTEPISLEPLAENPEKLWERAVEHLKRSLSIDSLTPTMTFGPQNGEIPGIKNHLETVETAVPDGNQLRNTETYTPNSLTREQAIAKIQERQYQGDSQTKIIEILWRVQKNRSGWKQAYKQFKELMSGDQK